MLGDKGYDNDSIRRGLRYCGGVPKIPIKRNRHFQRGIVGIRTQRAPQSHRVLHQPPKEQPPLRHP